MTTIILPVLIWFFFLMSITATNVNTGISLEVVFPPSQSVLIRSPGNDGQLQLRLVATGINHTDHVYFLRMKDLNAPYSKPMVMLFAEELTIKADANVIGTLVYEFTLFVISDKVETWIASTTVFYELTWNEETLSSARTFHSPLLSNDWIRPNIADASTDQSVVSSRPIRVLHVAGGTFDGQKQIMIEQWRSIDPLHVQFVFLWICTSPAFTDSECDVDPAVATALERNPHVQWRKWLPIPVKPTESEKHEHPHDGISLATYLEQSNPNGTPLSADVYLHYLIHRLRATTPSRSIDHVTPSWVRTLWQRFSFPLEGLLPIDIIVQGNNGGSSDTLIPEAGLALGGQAVLLDIAANLNQPDSFFEFHAVVSPSTYAAKNFPHTGNPLERYHQYNPTILADSSMRNLQDHKTNQQQQPPQTDVLITSRNDRKHPLRFIVPPGVDIQSFDDELSSHNGTPSCPHQCPFQSLVERLQKSQTHPQITGDTNIESDRNTKDAFMKGGRCRSSCLVVGFVGRFVSPKAPGMFLLAAQAILQQQQQLQPTAASKHAPEDTNHHTIVFAMVGDGPLRSSLEEYATRLGIRDRVYFPGAIKQPHLALFYASMDIFVMPSMMPSETFGIVLIEAMSLRVPVVSFGLFGQTEILYDIPSNHRYMENNTCADTNKEQCLMDESIHINNTNYIPTTTHAAVITLVSPNILAQGVLTLLRNTTLRRDMGEQARKVVLSRFTSVHNGHAMTQVYRTLLT